MSSSSNNLIERVGFAHDWSQRFEDVTEELEVFEEEEEDETEDAEVINQLLQEAPLNLEEINEWIRGMTRNERQHWDQWVRDLRSYSNALISLGFNPADVQHYLGEKEK